MKVFKRIVIGFGALILFVVLWGLVEPYFINTEEEAAAITNLPEEWEGQEIAVIGDFQVGMWMDNTWTIERVVDRLIEREPAAVLLTGDHVYHVKKGSEKELDQVLELLEPLAETDIPVMTVMGNHDYSMEKKDHEPDTAYVEKMSEKFEELGIHVLENEHFVLNLTPDGTAEGEPDGQSLYIGGIGSSWAAMANVEETLSGIPDDAPRFMLMHNPQAFKSIPADSAPAATAGHTHGGQISIPFTPHWSYMTLFKGEEVHAAGWAEADFGEKRNLLYVNPGIGFSDVPLRFTTPPEITYFELKQKS
ncbi:metallophosphoesterase [Jeotgalibacillus salarius]|uniref:Metallophosphoesterase n=1 Tax=Jeotgalibacillus salarius TaxID=546023 RepID=A0A4Y8LAW5_9BACL|nr:metallophosphoesterase [Jeotgalibacillus salarius]TFD99795.1 metallophosphoesterase [Jeotgalibacillus salarius]